MGDNGWHPTSPDCECGLRRDVHETLDGYEELLDPYTFTVATVPPDEQWFIAPDGRAVKGGGEDLPADASCRVRHDLVCPLGERPDERWTCLVALWDHYGRRTGLLWHGHRTEAG
ncbi:DUF6083 domain-containing protein [Streptomyces sp. NPDC053048]|uniref:DUF6083 domain-containing protein n=1 Tax=Streptomyces sp. NPDC053048 TaxID=3365694 RepID=UPI0037D45901